MKAIIISDESSTISKLDYALVSAGFDTIIYRWLLKALDNIEEIRPNLVIVSASEYPRHWKTLTQFIASGIGGDKTKVFLLSLNPMNEEEIDKAKALGISGFIYGTDDEDLQEFKTKLFELFPSPNLPANKTTVVEHTEEDYEDDIPTVSGIQENHKLSFKQESVCLVFMNPKNGKLVTGSVISYENKTVHFKPDYPNKIESLTSGDIINYLTLEIDNAACSYRGEVIMNNNELLLRLEEIHG